MNVILTDYKSTKAWGVNPASASGTYVIDGENADFVLQAGAAITYSGYGIDVFYGIVSSVKLDSAFATGKRFTFEAVDNRIRLQWMMCFCALNMEDDTCSHGLLQPNAPGDAGAADFQTGGSDVVTGNDVTSSSGPDAIQFPTGYVMNPERRRRFKSLLPENFDTGIWVYHDQPFTAREILNICFKGAVGHNFGFSRHHHSRSSEARPLNMDFTRGSTLANVITALNEKTGLDVYLENKRDLRWGIKGEGEIPVFTAADPQTVLGESITADPTRIRVLGSGSQLQVLNLEMEYNWNREWEKFLGEHAWLDEVATTWAIDKAAQWAEVAALAREVTLYDYVKKKNDASYADYRHFGNVSRMNMSAWVYMQEVVFKSYAVPPHKRLLDEIPYDSLRIAQSLLCAVEMEDDGLKESSGMRYQRAPIEFYPGTRAFVMAQGQPLDAIDAKDINTFVNLRTADMRKTWRVVQDYEIEECGVALRFRQPYFIDGDASKNESIFAFPNKGEIAENEVTGVEPQSELLRVVVPNAKYKITPAKIKVSLCFDMPPFWMEYGSGPRYGVIPADGLAAHVLHGDSSFDANGVVAGDPEVIRLPSSSQQTFRELVYADGKTAKEKAFEVWRSREGYSAFQQDGQYVRKGSVGAKLSGVIDRISVSIDFSGGITETVDFVKARTARMFFGEKTMARLQRMGELYVGNEANSREIRNIKRIAAANRYAAMSSRSTSHNTVLDVLRVPIGGGDAQKTKMVNGSVVQSSRGDKAKSGDVIWVDSSGNVAEKGRTFAGIVTLAQNENPLIPVAYAGTVPVRVKGKFQPGQAVFADKGSYFGVAKYNGDSVMLGTYAHADTTDDDEKEYHALVRLGFVSEDKVGPYVYTVRKSKDEWEVSFTPGYVIEQLVHTDDSLLFHDTDLIEDDNQLPIWHPIKIGQTAYVYYETTGTGDVKADTVKISIGEKDQKSTAYKPKCEESEVEGKYYCKLIEFDLSPSGAATIKPFHTGENIVHVHNLADMENSHSGDRRVFQKFDPAAAKYVFRDLKSVGKGVPILPPIDGDEGNDIPFRSIAGSGDESAAASGIKISLQDKDTILVSDSGPSGSLNFINCANGNIATLKVEKGRVTLITDATIKIPACPSTSSGSSIP